MTASLMHLALDDILDMLNTGIVLYDAQTGAIRDCNKTAALLFGLTVDHFKTLNFAALHLEPSAAEAFNSLGELELQSRDQFFTEWPLRRADGSVFPAELRLRPHHIEGEALYLLTIDDLTRQQEYEDSLALAQQVFDNAAEAVMITDAENRIVRINSAFTRITGWTAEESLGRNPSFLSSGKQSPEFYREMWQTLSEAGVWQGEVVNRRRSGQYYPEWLSISTVRNRQGKVTHYLAIFSDISERKRAEGLIHRYSWFDSLTDLPNKALLIDRINQAIIAAQNEGKPLYLLAFNLNRLKHINDSLGHNIGDEVLKIVAQRLVKATREGDTVSRVTGDDFVVVVPRLSQPHRAINLAERLVESINAPMDIQGNAIHITANAGLSVFPADGTEPDTLLMNADAALNHSRTQGQNKIAFFEPHMNAAILEKINLQGELTAALAQHQFLLHFQPQLDLQTQRLTGVEALIRWQHPERGLVSPAVFIPAAEELGLIVQIGDWVIDEACRQHRQWLTAGLPPIPVAVNVSMQQLRQADFRSKLLQSLARLQLPPTALNIEVTETAMMEDPERVTSLLAELRGDGIGISLDDFGTGYSSLSCLSRLPIDKIKIDKSFIWQLADKPESRAITEAIIMLGQRLSLQVVAEGIETESMRSAVAALGCTELQGFLISYPLSAGRFVDWFGQTAAANGRAMTVS